MDANRSPHRLPETSSAAAVSAAASTTNNDPLHQTVAVLESESKPADTIAALYSLYKSSPDVRAVLRLIDPAFIDILSAGARFSFDNNSLATGGSIVKDTGAGTYLMRLLTAQALGGSDGAAEMLGDMLDNSHGHSSIQATMGLEISTLRASIVQNILQRIRDGCPDSGSFTRLLGIVESIATAKHAVQDDELFSWIPLLVSTIGDALIDIDDFASLPETVNDAIANKASRLLRLLTFVSEQYNAHAIHALSTLPSLRTLTRRIIKMLSAPVPLVAAPALHALTLIVLGTSNDVVPSDSPLTDLSRSLSAKLFDAEHITRTLTLVVDFCLNCQEPTNDPKSVPDDLLVLEAVSGIVGAIVRTKSNARGLFYQSTAIVHAVNHLQQLASFDHRYLTPLLSVVGSIVSLSDDAWFMKSPLLQALFYDSDCSKREGPATSDGDCVVNDVAEFVALCFEDAVDMMLPFPMVMGGKMLNLRNDRVTPDHQSMWMCTSYEGSYGWCFNSGWKEQRRIGRDLACLLEKQRYVQGSDGAGSKVEQINALHRVLDTVVKPYLSSYIDADLLGATVMELDENTAERQLVQQLAYIGCHYWIVKPVLTLVTDLAYGTHIAAQPSSEVQNHELQKLFDWARSIGTKNKEISLRQSVLSVFASNKRNDSSPMEHQQNSVPLSAVTPDSAFSSPGSVTPGIAMDELRKASNNNVGRKEEFEATGLGISMDHALYRSRLAQVIIIGHWKHTCDTELAQLLVQLSEATHAKGGDDLKKQIEQVSSTSNAAGNSCRLPGLYDCISAVVDLYSQHTAAKIATESTFARAMQRKQEELMGAGDEIAYLSNELQCVQGQHSELTGRINRYQEINGELEQESKRLKTSFDELDVAHRRVQADASEWKDECMATRDLLDKSEDSGKQTRMQLEQLSEMHGRLEREYEREQEIWGTKHREMAKSNKELEMALANAVTRLRGLESQADLDRSINEELRRQNAAMAMRLSEFSKLSETLHNLSRIPQ
ncbi:hypothetical protein IW140_006033 [Coemansia sp. RSA 1813]|nr:hypothetical protein LPJ74_005662 [Coemansia sp. RSA 1843]KAJ2085824.1 hypothetical protein IW138_006084 [Coemansia sp. RSA 986]KAJ2210688.1 hypothetical protein EV179_006071 [Coemansia sp. RSA 487]KAJ2563638.1 hypothetical protein IW140_006033 [Coemansia sp. RSA 1813]